MNVPVDLTAYPVDFGGLWWTNRPPGMAGPNSKTTLVDSGGRLSLCMAFRRSGVRIPSGPPSISSSKMASCHNPQPVVRTKSGDGGLDQGLGVVEGWQVIRAG